MITHSFSLLIHIRKSVHLSLSLLQLDLVDTKDAFRRIVEFAIEVVRIDAQDSLASLKISAVELLLLLLTVFALFSLFFTPSNASVDDCMTSLVMYCGYLRSSSSQIARAPYSVQR